MRLSLADAERITRFPILLSTDLSASLTFYRDQLGLELVDERESASSSAAAVGRG